MFDIFQQQFGRNVTNPNYLENEIQPHKAVVMDLRLGEQDIRCQIIGGAEHTIWPFFYPQITEFPYYSPNIGGVAAPPAPPITPQLQPQAGIREEPYSPMSIKTNEK